MYIYTHTDQSMNLSKCCIYNFCEVTTYFLFNSLKILKIASNRWMGYRNSIPSHRILKNGSKALYVIYFTWKSSEEWIMFIKLKCMHSHSNKYIAYDSATRKDISTKQHHCNSSNDITHQFQNDAEHSSLQTPCSRFCQAWTMMTSLVEREVLLRFVWVTGHAPFCRQVGALAVHGFRQAVFPQHAQQAVLDVLIISSFLKRKSTTQF